MRRILATAAVLLAAGAFVALTLGSSSSSSSGTYKVELQNAFGLVNGGDFKVAGATVGKVESIDLCGYTPGAHCQYKLDAVVTVSVSRKGFGQFRSDAFCQSRPQSLIGEYFLDCDPGSSGRVLKPGSTIPVSHTQSTIPADLVQNIMQLPYRERFALLINELGAAVAARSMDIQSALRRADPALAQTDNLLALLANDAETIKQLNVGANTVISALATNSKQVQRFIVEANNAASESSSPAANPASCGYSAADHCIEATWQKLPAFLAQLRPALQKLGAAADAQDPVFTNLNQAASNLHRFFVNLVPFSNQSRVSIACGENGQAACPQGGNSLGTLSATGISAVRAATPTVADLQRFAGPVGCDSQAKQIFNCTPELAQNLAIVLNWIDNRKHAVEPDPRSPAGGVGYTGLEGVLEYVFNITNAINTFTTWGHQLAVDLFASTTCSPYATPQTIANNISTYEKGGGNLNSDNPSNPRTCYAWLGPNQPGVNETDPTWTSADKTPANPSPCVPDPGGYPIQGYGTSYYGPSTSACKLQAANPASSGGSPTPTPPTLPLSRANSSSSAAPSSSSGGGSSSTSNVMNAVGRVISQVGSSTGTPTTPSTATNTGSSSSAGSAQQLLNYLLAP
jgi:phospholipid/cholesterol/gamma-HCH transport system substrate-binding protein